MRTKNWHHERNSRTTLSAEEENSESIETHVGSRTDPGDHRENRSCQRMECLPCREAGKVAGIEVAEGRFSQAAGLRWRSFGFRRADRGRERNSSLASARTPLDANDLST